MSIAEATDAPLRPQRNSRLLVKDVLKAVADDTGVSAHWITGRTQLKHVLKARFYFYYLGVELTGMPVGQFSEKINRDHTTVAHAIRKMHERMAAGDETLKSDIDRITAALA